MICVPRLLCFTARAYVDEIQRVPWALSLAKSPIAITDKRRDVLVAPLLIFPHDAFRASPSSGDFNIFAVRCVALFGLESEFPLCVSGVPCETSVEEEANILRCIFHTYTTSTTLSLSNQDLYPTHSILGRIQYDNVCFIFVVCDVSSGITSHLMGTAVLKSNARLAVCTIRRLVLSLSFTYQ